MFSVLEADHPVIRCLVRPAVGMIGIVSILAVLLPGAMAADVRYQGTITAFKLNVRSAPRQNADVVVVLDRGTRVEVTDVVGGIGGWATIQYQQFYGYVRNRPRYIKLAPVPSKAVSLPVKTSLKADTRIAGNPVEDRENGTTTSQDFDAGKESGDRKYVSAEQDKQTIQSDIAVKKAEVTRFSQKEMEMIQGLNEIDYSLNQARLRANALSGEIRMLDETISATRAKQEELAAQIRENQVYAGDRLEALYRMHMMGSLDMMGLPESIFDFFVKQNALERIIRSDYQVLENQTQDLVRLNALQSSLADRRATRSVLEQDLNGQIQIREKEAAKKQVILTEIREKKALTQAALAALQQAAHQLDDTMDAMEESVSSSIKTALFSRQKGRLTFPVAGRIMSGFGPSQSGDYKSFTFQSGIDIKVERGEPVRSVFSGKVMFAEWLKGYGNLLIIDHGENYYTLYAHVQEMFKEKGETVDTGEVIATAGDTGSIKGLCLHFEVRHHGRPVDPLKWLNKGA